MKDRNGTELQIGSSLVSDQFPRTLEVECIDLGKFHCILKQKIKNYAPWVLTQDELLNAQWIVTKQPEKEHVD